MYKTAAVISLLVSVSFSFTSFQRMPQVELNLKCCHRIFKDRLPFQTTNQQVSNHTRLINATITTLHPFNGFFSRTTWVSRYQKGKNQSGFKRGKRLWDSRIQWHHLDHMQTICNSLQKITTTTPNHLIFTGQMLFLTPKQQCQSTEGKYSTNQSI